MTKTVRLAPGLALADDVLTDVTAIVGRRGRGKTNTATVIVEEAHRVGMRFVVIDPVGVWWGLRSSKDGKAAGIPCVVMGGEHPMTPLEPTSGQVVADFVTSSDVAGVVLDFRLMRKGETVRFMTAFLERLYLKNREDLLVVIDEADKFAPQRPFGEEARLLGACEDVVKMGRARGLHPILITQRPATLSKNVLTQAGMLVAHTLPAPQDQKAIDAWIRERADEEHRAEVLSTLGGLERGEAWVWAPERELLKRVTIRERETFDSSATPKRGVRRAEPKVRAEIDLEKLSADIRATVERAKADDPKELRRQVVELKTQLAAAARKPAPAMKEPAPRLAVKETQVKRLHELARRCEVAADRNQAAVDALRKEASTLKGALAALGLSPRPAAGPGSNAWRGAAPVPPPPPPPRAARGPASIVEGVTPARQRILDALAWLESVRIPVANRTQLAMLADQSPTSSSYQNNLGGLRSLRLLEYVAAGIQLTDEGRAAAASPDTPPTSAELQASIMRRLPPARARILAELIRAYPRGLARGALADLAAQSATSSSYQNNLGALRSLGVIDYRGGEVVALPVLFLEG